ncbi:MAG: molybdopterin-dependent oxidoreductase [Frankia sp.]|nr:molybdopterin-dependent oxidoreductase [Frankia sp.]
MADATAGNQAAGVGDVVEVDGTPVAVPDALAAAPLAEMLRQAGFTGVKTPCGEGGCGGCTVLLDGVPVTSCVVPAARARGRRVRTAPAITADDGVGARLAGELARRGALQCGYCVPGLVASASALLERTGDGAVPTADEARAALAGHLCRCTGYEGLVDAVRRAAAGTAGEARPRTDGPGRARGTLRFAADHGPAAGALTGLLLTAQTAGARVEVSPESALRVPGAVAVLGPRDAPAALFSTNPHVEDDVLAPAETPVFAARSRFVGDVVGLVVAETPAAAREMAALVEVRETPEPGEPSLSAGEAVFRHAVGVEQEVLDAAMAAADVVVTGSYVVEPGPVAALERPAALAAWSDGRCLIHCTSQTPQVVRVRVARLLGVAAEAVEVAPVPLGGGFGLKEEVFLEVAAAVAARHCGGRPVLVEMTRAQLGALRRRHGATVEVATGCAADGTMLARSVTIRLDAGAEVSHSALVLENAMLVAAQVYPVGATRVSGTVTLTPHTPSCAFRGYGAMEAGFALESHMDELVRRFGADPVQYRRRHVLRAGGRDRVNGWPVVSYAADACLDAVAEAAAAHPLAPDDPDGRWRRGRGLAWLTIVSSASSAAHLDEASANVRVDPDGTVAVETVVPDMGQGLHSMLAGVAADRLGVPPERVRVEQQPATGGTPADEGTFASRGVYLTANAVAAAADELGRCPRPGARAQGRAVAPDNGLVAGAQLVDVAVDTWTGAVRVERVVSVHDVGRVLEPALARGQVVGGVVQGIGVALGERLRHVDGVPLEVNLLDQPIPTTAAAPQIIDRYVGDAAATPGRLGAKGLGEAPMVGVPAAIANAVYDAVGVRLRSLPLHPEAVLAASGPPRGAAWARAQNEPGFGTGEVRDVDRQAALGGPGLPGPAGACGVLPADPRAAGHRRRPGLGDPG